MAQVAFLHTSPVHVATFNRLFLAEQPEWSRADLFHDVDVNLLAQARQDGLTPELRQTIVNTLLSLADEAPFVICTCSTIGACAPEAQQQTATTQILRVDQPMADLAVASGQRILVAATLESTLEPTRQLLEETAAALSRSIDLEFCFCSTAWPFFAEGDLDGYAAAIATAIRSAVTIRKSDVVVLAQASMAPAALLVDDLGLPVLSSPAAAVAYVLASMGA